MASTLPGDEGEGARPTERKRALTPTRVRPSAPLPREGAQIGFLFERNQAAFRMRMRRKQSAQLCAPEHQRGILHFGLRLTIRS